MAVEPRREPYIWPTWICGLLAGESHCEWAAWFRSHYQGYAKVPRTVDLTVWTAEHGRMVRQRAEELRQAGYSVYVEDQNSFSLKGKVATLGGKADIVAVREGDALVVDCKSGKPHDKDIWQVFIYMLVLPLAHAACQGRTLRGELQYPDWRLEIDAARLTNKVTESITSTIQRVARMEPLPVVSSVSECRFCDLTAADCKDRMEAPAAEAVTHDLW